MKKYIPILLVLVSILLIFTGCSQETVFGEIDFSVRGVEIQNVNFGISLEELMEQEGLQESDVRIREIADIGTTFLEIIEPKSYSEISPYYAQKVYAFANGQLDGVAYTVAYRDVPYEDAYRSAMNAYETIDSAINRNVKRVITGSIESLNEVGGQYTIQYLFKDQTVTVNMNYQDMSEATYTDMDQFNFSINIFSK